MFPLPYFIEQSASFAVFFFLRLTTVVQIALPQFTMPDDDMRNRSTAGQCRNLAYIIHPSAREYDVNSGDKEDSGMALIPKMSRDLLSPFVKSQWSSTTSLQGTADMGQGDTDTTMLGKASCQLRIPASISLDASPGAMDHVPNNILTKTVASRSRIEAAEWEDRKFTIGLLYIDGNLNLEDVMHIMKTRHNFHAR